MKDKADVANWRNLLGFMVGNLTGKQLGLEYYIVDGRACQVAAPEMDGCVMVLMSTCMKLLVAQELYLEAEGRSFAAFYWARVRGSGCSIGMRYQGTTCRIDDSSQQAPRP